MKTLLTNGKLVHPDRIEPADILFSDDKIEAVGQSLAADGAEKIDCTGRLIFPGIIDPHTHFGIPIKDGRSADDFASGSRAALLGGVTTVIDFTSLERGQSLADSVASRRKLAEVSLCDYSLHCNVTRLDDNILAEIPEIIDSGVSSFKVFTTYREGGLYLDYPRIEELAGVLSKYGGLLMVHAEDDGILQAAREKLDPDSTDPSLHGVSRPAAAEVRAIEKIANIVTRTGCPTYIVHLSSAAGLTVASRFPELILETCPQYLLLDNRRYADSDGRMYVASPPLRKPADNLALWQAVQKSQIATLGTDHCPFNLDDKKAHIPFTEIPNGMGGVSLLFPLMLAEFLQRSWDLSLLARLLSANAAAIFQLAPTKGRISVGSDADLVVVDPSRVTRDWLPEQIGTIDWTPYRGMAAIFPERVYLRGRLAVDKGTILAHAPGQFIAAHSADQAC